MNGSGCSVQREYISLEALERELKKLMARKDVSSWVQTAFDAADIDLLIHEIPEEYIIVLEADGTMHRANDKADKEAGC